MKIPKRVEELILWELNGGYDFAYTVEDADKELNRLRDAALSSIKEYKDAKIRISNIKAEKVEIKSWFEYIKENG